MSSTGYSSDGGYSDHSPPPRDILNELGKDKVREVDAEDDVLREEYRRVVVVPGVKAERVDEEALYDEGSEIYNEYGLFGKSVRQKDVKYFNATYTGLVHSTTGLPHGHGVKYYSNGSTLKCGHWINGVPNGDCLLTHINGEVYRGTWSNGHREGKGRLIKANGAIYEETYSQGVRTHRVALYKPPGTNKKPSTEKSSFPDVSPTQSRPRKPDVPRLSKKAVSKTSPQKSSAKNDLPPAVKRKTQPTKKSPPYTRKAARPHKDSVQEEQITVATLLACS